MSNLKTMFLSSLSSTKDFTLMCSTLYLFVSLVFVYVSYAVSDGVNSWLQAFSVGILWIFTTLYLLQVNAMCAMAFSTKKSKVKKLRIYAILSLLGKYLTVFGGGAFALVKFDPLQGFVIIGGLTAFVSFVALNLVVLKIQTNK